MGGRVGWAGQESARHVGGRGEQVAGGRSIYRQERRTAGQLPPMEPWLYH